LQGLNTCLNLIKQILDLDFYPLIRGHGIATEVSLPIIKYSFETLGLKEIIGIADPVNKGPIKVLQKIGLTYYKKAIYDEGTAKKYLWYKIKRSLIKSHLMLSVFLF